MGFTAGLDAAHVAQALGEGRGSQADLVVAVMAPKGTGRIDFYEVRKPVNLLHAQRARTDTAVEQSS